MEINDFISKFGETLDIENVSSLQPSTKFRDLDEWGSLSILALIAMADEEYNREISVDQINDAKTIEDLFNLVKK